MKVLFCVDDFKGGAGNVIQLLSKEFKRHNHDVSICLLGGETPGRYSIEGIPLYRIKSRKNKILRYLNFVHCTRRIIEHERPDCVVSFLFGVSSWVNLALVGMNIPLIVSERSDPNYLFPKGIMALLTDMSYKRANRIVVLFDDFKRFFSDEYFDKIITIPNPVPEISLPPTKSHSYDDEIRFVTIANDTPPKGLSLLVQAFANIESNNRKIVLRIYGKETNRLRNQIIDLGLEDKIFLMGYTLDVTDALSWADVYIMPSVHEGFPNSLCEAMSAGKCCIATLCHKGINDIIVHGQNGLIASNVSSESILEQVRFVLNNPELIDEMATRAKELSRKYPMDKVYKMWENLIIDTIKE